MRLRRVEIFDGQLSAPRPESVPEFSGVEETLRVEGGFEIFVGGGEFRADGLRPPAFFCEADAVFAGDGAAPGEDFGKEGVEGG